MKKAIIVGAGIAGIATSIRLALKGFEVQVFEANSYPGGKLTELECKGYRFDAGPSLFTMPQYVDELFSLAGRSPRDHFNYQRLDTICNYFFEEGTKLSAYADAERFAREISEKTADSKEKVHAFLKKSQTIYQITNHVFLEKSLHKLKTYLNTDTLLSLARIAEIDSMRTMAQANFQYFSDSRTSQLFNRYATYNGSNPYKAPATLNVIPHLEYHYGAYFPEGGMHQISLCLAKLAEDVGVTFNYDTRVDRILTKGDRVEGVMAAGSVHEADVVVSNMDVWFTFNKLLPQVKAPKKTLDQERSSSALIFYWGIKKEFPGLDLHNIFFSANYEQEFKEIWENKTISNDPTIYLNISSKFKRDDAPPGAENWFVMINVPSNQGQDWDRLINEARSSILSKLKRLLKEDIQPLIECELILDPRSIESRTSSYQGSLYGTSSNNKFAAFLRHPNFSPKVKGLYFVGGSVHPGGGIPLALLSAKIAGDLIS